MRLQYADFIEYGSGLTESPAIANALDANIMYLTVISETDPAVTVQVMTDADPDTGTWLDVAVTLTDGTTAEKVTENGLYCVSVGGARYIRALSDDADATLQVYASLYNMTCGEGTLTEGDMIVAHNIAPEYDDTKTYAVGDMCTRDTTLYVCTTEIAAAEAWNSGHWSPTTVDAVTSALNESVNALEGSSATVVSATSPNDDGIDLDVIDSNGNVVLRLQDGYVKTKKFDPTDIYELPSYYVDHVINKAYRINQLRETTGGDVFIFCTDQHMLGNSRQSYKLIHHLAERCNINKLFMGGDLINGVDKTFTDEFRNAIGGKAHFLVGNHEYFNAGNDKAFTGVFASGFDDEVSGPEVLRRYYWVDNPAQKIRYIVTNGYKSDGEGGYTIGFDSTQTTWLTDVAMNVDEGWKCIIFSHMFWNSASETVAGLVLPADYEAVLDAIDAANTDGQVLAIIQGHTHQDAVKATTGGIPILITTADRHRYDDPDYEPYMNSRVPGTVTEQAMDVCVVDREGGKLYAVRVGGYNTGDADEEAALTAAGERVLDI